METVAPSFKTMSRHLYGAPKEKNKNLHQVIQLCVHYRTRTPHPNIEQCCQTNVIRALNTVFR
jgi:hypothetical protein